MKRLNFRIQAKSSGVAGVWSSGLLRTLFVQEKKKKCKKKKIVAVITDIRCHG